MVPAHGLSSEQELCVLRLLLTGACFLKGDRSWCGMNIASLRKYLGKCYQKGELPRNKGTNSKHLICSLLRRKGLPSSTSQSTRQPPLSPDVNASSVQSSCSLPCHRKKKICAELCRLKGLKPREARYPFVFVLTMSPRTPGGPGAPNSP